MQHEVHWTGQKRGTTRSDIRQKHQAAQMADIYTEWTELDAYCNTRDSAEKSNISAEDRLI